MSVRETSDAEPSSLTFGILGELEMLRGGAPVSCGGPRQRALLALLLIEANQIVPIERLVDELWALQPSAHATETLMTYVSRLRRTLEPDRPRGCSGQVLVTRPPGYLLRVQRDQVDSLRFEDLVQEGRSALANAEHELAERRLGDALGLWRGAPLSDFIYEPFAQAEAARLKELRLLALEDLMQANLALGRHAACVPQLETLVDAHPLRERLREQLMLALYRSGRQADALETFHVGRRRLAEELGIEPSPQVRRLHEDILLQQPGLDWRPPVVAITATDRPPVAPRATNGTRARTATTVSLVGRSRELAVLDAGLSEARGGRGTLLLIAGEPGIGKSRLVEELAERAAVGGADVVWGRCYEGSGAPPFWPWIEVVRALSERTDPQVLRRALGAGAGRISRVVPELAELLPDLQPEPVFDGEAARFGLYDSLTRFLLRLATRSPLVVALEDLQWADVPSLELLEFLSPRVGTAAILVAGSYRDVETLPPHPLANVLTNLCGQRAVRRLELEGLEQRDVAVLIANATGGEARESLVSALHSRTDGNPFFLSQLLHLVGGKGELDQLDEGVILLRKVPGGVRDAIRRRLARLPDESVRLLRAAAVVGETFELELVAGVLDEDPERALEQVERALLERLVSERPEVGRYRFSHALIREALYDELSAMRRARLHRRVGQVLERCPGATETRVGELAHHFFEGAAAGAVDKALLYGERAAQQAMDSLAYEQAEELLRRSMTLLETAPPEPARARRELALQEQLSLLLMMSRGYSIPEVRDVCERMRALCRETGAVEHLTAPLCRLGLFYMVRGELERADELGHELLKTGRTSGQPAMRLGGTLLLALNAFQRGELLAARDLLEDGLALSDSFEDPSLTQILGHDPRVALQSTAAWTLSLLGEHEAARRASQESLRLAQRGSPDEALALFYDACRGVFGGDVDLARQRAEEALALCEERGFALRGATARIVRGWAVAKQGQPQAGTVEMREGFAAVIGTGAGRPRLATALVAEGHQLGGRPEEALALVEGAITDLQTGEGFYDAELYRLKGELLQAVRPDAASEAIASLRQAVAVAKRQHSTTLERRAAQSLLRALSG